MKRKWLFRLLLGLLGAVIGFQALFLLYFRAFYSTADKAFWVPGLNGDFVPQGIDACAGGYLISGYRADSGTSRVYWVAPDGATNGMRVRLEDGGVLACHAGGIAAGDTFTYLVGGGQCYVLSTEALMDPERTEAEVLGSFSTGNRASFCCLTDGMLVVGEYACGERYTTAETHRMTTPAGDRNTALAWVFPLDETEPFGVREVPEAAVSLPERIQGLCLSNDGRAVLSASSAFGASQLYLYDVKTVTEGRQGICFWDNSHPVPLFYVDSAAGTDILPLPPKAEEPMFHNGKLYILFESASYRFRYGKLVGGNYVYSMSLPERGD